MPTLATHGIELAYDDRGDGPPLLLLHGSGGSADNWRHVFDLDALAATRRLIAPDARGHGRSSNPGGAAAFSTRRCAEDTLALLDHLGLDRVRAIGLSMGGNTLLHLATIAPGRVDAMVLVSATMYFPAEARAIMRASDVPHVRAWGESVDDMAFTPPHLARIATPTLIVYGDRDPLYPVEMAVAMYRALPAAQLWVVPGAGHGPAFEVHAPAFARAALGFLDAHSDGAP
jgi:pimeloyl-ACP methyl ester carboxylesterase